LNKTNFNARSAKPLNPSLVFERQRDINMIKKCIWIYFFLVIFEGALRKWFLPFLSTPLLVVREPFVIYAVYLGIKNKLFPNSMFLILFVFISIIGVFAAIFFGHGNLIVALFGARIFLLHIPFMFLMPEIFSKDDLAVLGKHMLWISILMTVIVFLQFNSPQSAWINAGVGGDEAGAGFSGAMGYMRPPGTFSFTNGLTGFYSFAAPFIAFFWLSPQYKINKILLAAATISLIIAVPLSISRALFFNVGLVALFTIFISIRNPKFLSRILLAAVAFVVIFMVLSQQESFQLSIDVFTTRFEVANDSEGGLEGVFIDRFLGGMVKALSSSADIPIFGYGIGMGSNVGAILLSGSKTFLLPEGEWGRVIGELGILMGFIVVIMRILIAFGLLSQSFNMLAKKYTLPWLLMSTGFIVLLQGQWGQPTNLGFYIITAGTLMTSLKNKNNYSD